MLIKLALNNYLSKRVGEGRGEGDVDSGFSIVYK